MPTAKNLKDLEKILKQKIATSLQTDVSHAGREAMKDNIEHTVYEVYEPTMYQRQKDNGGLTDDENIITTMVNDTTLSIESHRMDGDKNVSETIITGKGYDFEFPYYNRPRDFIEATKEDLRHTKSHITALHRGLKKQGLNVEIN